MERIARAGNVGSRPGAAAVSVAAAWARVCNSRGGEWWGLITGRETARRGPGAPCVVVVLVDVTSPARVLCAMSMYHNIAYGKLFTYDSVS